MTALPERQETGQIPWSNHLSVVVVDSDYERQDFSGRATTTSQSSSGNASHTKSDLDTPLKN